MFSGIFIIRMVWSRLLQLLTFIICIKKREAPLPEGPFIICPNHQSYLDIVLMHSLFRHPFRFLGKAELLSWPIFGYFFGKTDIAVDRSNRKAAVRALDAASEAIDKGSSLVIFPEGTIPDNTPELKSFKNGAFSLAIKKQVPIVPVTMINHYKRFSDPGDVFGPAGPGLARSVIHAPIETKGMTQEDIVTLRERVYQTIKQTLKAYENR